MLATRYEITNPEPTVMVAIGVIEEGGPLRWFALAPPGTTQITIPQLPSTVAEADVLPPATYTARVQLCDRRPAAPYCDRTAWGRAFDVTP